MEKREKTKSSTATRSVKYQDKFKERYFENKDLEKYAGAYIPDTPEHIRDLNDALTKRLVQMVQEYCTPVQIDTFNLLLQGYGQREVAKIQGVNQSSVQKTIWGNRAVKVDGTRSRQGGLRRQIEKMMKIDNEYQRLLQARADAYAELLEIY